MHHLLAPLRILALVAVLLAVMLWLAPSAFRALSPTTLAVQYNPNRLERVSNNARTWASMPVQFQGTARCAACHQDKAATLEASMHRGLACETCHGPGKNHIEEGASLIMDTTPQLCARCHAAVEGRPSTFPQVNVDEHSMKLACVTCHNPHKPEMRAATQPTPAAPAVVATAAPAATPTLAPAATPTPGQVSTSQSASPTPTPVPASASQGAAPTSTPASPPPATPTPAPAVAGPPAIPHSLEGRSDCLLCHGPGRLKPVPPNHAGRSSDMCQLCHKPKG